MRPINRPPAILPVTAVQTYVVSSPAATHTRPASCREVDCRSFLDGWITVLPVGSPREADLRAGCAGRIDGYVRYFAVERDAGTVTFRFEPGQPCFLVTTHRRSLERPEIYLVRGGDWRAHTGLIRRHTRPEHWVEDFAENQDKLARRIGAG